MKFPWIFPHDERTGTMLLTRRWAAGSFRNALIDQGVVPVALGRHFAASDGLR